MSRFLLLIAVLGYIAGLYLLFAQTSAIQRAMIMGWPWA